MKDKSGNVIIGNACVKFYCEYTKEVKTGFVKGNLRKEGLDFVDVLVDATMHLRLCKNLEVVG